MPENLIINTDLNILGGLLDLNIVRFLLTENGEKQSYASIKTVKSFKRYTKAIKRTLLTCTNQKLEFLIHKIIEQEGISADSLNILFWNAAVNNDLIHYLNHNVFFPAYYGGRNTIKKDEVLACLNELKQVEPSIQNWTFSTIDLTASKYLTLLKKFNLMEGSAEKTISHTILSDNSLMLFIYWILAIETKSNLLESKWLEYCFMKKEIFIQRILQKKYLKFLNLNYSGDKLTVEPIILYEKIYDELVKS